MYFSVDHFLGYGTQLWQPQTGLGGGWEGDRGCHNWCGGGWGVGGDRGCHNWCGEVGRWGVGGGGAVNMNRTSCIVTDQVETMHRVAS